jgi:hypothetical protein
MLRFAALPIVMAVAVLGGGIVCAQSVPPASPPATAPAAPDSGACAPDARSPTTGSGQSKSDLGDRLASHNGVICPPSGVDPQMRVAPPGGGRMLVVPPPGSPGGDPNTVPK